MVSSTRRLGALALTLIVAAPPAWAHHVMGGEMPETFLQGLLSGFGHPVIGIDHLAAIVGVGILAALSGRSAAMVLAFSVAIIAGVGLHLQGVDLPAGELFVGLTTLVLGGLVILRPSMPAGAAALLFAVAGLVHGYALGESIVGAESAPLFAYLLGLLIVQTAIGVAVYGATRAMTGWPARVSGLTAAGAAVALAGGIATAQAAGIV
ncbi:HupE/UreJ family protein [Reyranella sp.]|uniref:HupE/UreJ family protein n=1 Tax=Reyranella sp. TaxID=1929291 RepID=UPI003BAD1D7F